MVDRIRLYTSPFITRNQEIKTLEKLNQVIKQASRDESSDQASFKGRIKRSSKLQGTNQGIKHLFRRSKFLIAITAGSTGHIVVTTPCCASITPL